MTPLKQAAAEYEERGFAIIRNVIPEDLLEEARSHVEWLTSKYPELRPEHFHHPLIRNDAFWVRLVTDPRLAKIGQHFLGPNLACFTAHYICKPPYDGQPVFWHQDGSYWKLAPMQALTVWLAIDESTTANGCLRMIPGSHKLPLHAPNLRTDKPNMLFSEADTDLVSHWAEEQGIVDIELNPGDVSIHHPHLLHCSEANTSAKRRCGLDIGYIATSTRIESRGLYLDPVMVAGEPLDGVNTYRRLPRYTPHDTIPFKGHETWNDQPGVIAESVQPGEAPLTTTERMIERLQEGTVAL
ncbi:phytanoyl-CoA dioxygenase family protein [Streptomyces sp. NPDC001513]|uniref:phytanoyl-CoA dioxygenase family protein n=1 Tax=Streptomyces sp. NPDC001513 TaxID=3364580 RepID=UPI0036A4391B